MIKRNSIAARAAAGFTLVELLVVLVIAALAMALVGTSISRSVSGAEMRTAARKVAASLRYTRTHAILTKSEQVFLVDTEKHSFQAAVACRMGWEAYDALKGLTRATAKGAMLDDRVGSIEAGKDGDLGVWTGDPVDPRSSCVMTVINGNVAYDATKERRY